MVVTRLEVTSRTIAGDGASFGTVGQYEFIVGILHYTVDPKHPDSQLITDIDLAPRGPDGKVHFSSDIQILKPVNAVANRSLLVDIVNRGNRTVMGFNDAPPTSPVQPPTLGNGFLMRHGFSIVFCGWQADVPDERIGLHVPEAQDVDGQQLKGQTYQQYCLSQGTYELLLADRDHKPLPAADLQERSAMLIEREWADGPATVIPRDHWLFARWVDGHPVADSHYVCLTSGFKVGMVYEVIYTTVGAPLIGLGFLALRDCGSFFRYGSAEEGNPCSDTISQAHVYGISQTGRTLREFLYLGLNQDEAGRLVYDGAMPHLASSRMGEFNFRFGQPSSNSLRNVGNARPLAYTPETDPLTGDSDGLLRRLEAKDAAPKIIATNSSVEYWWSGASLTHTDLQGKTDLDQPANIRIYHFAGTKHASGSLPLTDIAPDGTRQQHYSNTLDYRPIQRAMLYHLDCWVRNGVEPPSSQIPRLADGTAVRREALAEFFRANPLIGFPKALPLRCRLAYGSEMAKGVPQYPAIEGEPYGTLVSAVDSDGNEIAGVRLPDIRVPLGTHTGWTMRHADSGGDGHFIPIQGAVIPFVKTADERQANSDLRPSLEERYISKEDYLERIKQSVKAMVKERLILDEDVERIIEGAGQRWDAFHVSK